MTTKTFVTKSGVAAGMIPLGPELRVRVEPGVPFEVPANQAQRFAADPNYEEVPAPTPKRKGRSK